jgi:uncharacterized Tic20 family protein
MTSTNIFLSFSWSRDLRNSLFRTITDGKLFDLVDHVISNIKDKEGDSYRYTLRRNDITHIKYEKGGE